MTLTTSARRSAPRPTVGDTVNVFGAPAVVVNASVDHDTAFLAMFASGEEFKGYFEDRFTFTLAEGYAVAA